MTISALTGTHLYSWVKRSNSWLNVLLKDPNPTLQGSDDGMQTKQKPKCHTKEMFYATKLATLAWCLEYFCLNIYYFCFAASQWFCCDQVSLLSFTSLDAINADFLSETLFIYRYHINKKFVIFLFVWHQASWTPCWEGRGQWLLYFQQCVYHCSSGKAKVELWEVGYVQRPVLIIK